LQVFPQSETTRGLTERQTPCVSCTQIFTGVRSPRRSAGRRDASLMACPFCSPVRPRRSSSAGSPASSSGMWACGHSSVSSSTTKGWICSSEGGTQAGSPFLARMKPSMSSAAPWPAADGLDDRAGARHGVARRRSTSRLWSGTRCRPSHRSQDHLFTLHPLSAGTKERSGVWPMAAITCPRSG